MCSGPPGGWAVDSSFGLSVGCSHAATRNKGTDSRSACLAYQLCTASRPAVKPGEQPGKSGLTTRIRPPYTKPPNLTYPLQRQRSIEAAAAAVQVSILQINYRCMPRAIAGLRNGSRGTARLRACLKIVGADVRGRFPEFNTAQKRLLTSAPTGEQCF